MENNQKNQINIELTNITKARNKNAKEFEKSIIKSLADLNFNQADFKVEIKELPEFGINGLDKVKEYGIVYIFYQNKFNLTTAIFIIIIY